MFLGVPPHVLLIDHDQASEVLSCITNDDCIGDVGTEFKQTFDVTRGDIFPA